MSKKNYVAYGDAETVVSGIARVLRKKEPSVFKGSQSEWDALTPAQQSTYEIRIINDDFITVIYSGSVVNVVESGNNNAVSSNAVYLYLKKIKDHPDDLTYTDSDPDYVPPASVQTGETFDTITETWADGSQDVFGVGVLNKGADDETITRFIYPDGSEMTFTGW